METMNPSIDHKVYEVENIVIPFIKNSPFNTFVLAAKRKYGKTKLIRNLIHIITQHIATHNIIVFSETAYRNLKTISNYEEGAKDNDYAFLRDCPYVSFLDADNETIDDAISWLENWSTDQKNKDVFYSCLIIFDDVNVDEKNKGLTKVFTRGRHFNWNVIVSVQSLSYFLNKGIRGNVDLWFLGLIEEDYRKNMYKSTTLQMKFSDFRHIINNLVVNHQFVCYNSQINDIVDISKIKIIRAKIYKSIKICKDLKKKQVNKKVVNQLEKIEEEKV